MLHILTTSEEELDNGIGEVVYFWHNRMAFANNREEEEVLITSAKGRYGPKPLHPKYVTWHQMQD